MARRAAFIRFQRDQAQHALVLDAGNSLLGDSDPAVRTRARTSIEAMNRMGYDALALGMQDISLLELSELRERMAEAQFPVLSANACLTGTTELLTDPYVVLAMADHRVGILGLTDAGGTEEVVATDPVLAARKWLPRLQRMADIIILLSHAGLDIDQVIAGQVPGIDVIVSGHTGSLTQPIVSRPSGTILLHADHAVRGSAGTRLGIAHLSFDKAGSLAEYEWRKIILTSEFGEDPEVAAWAQEMVYGGCE
ncbi:MAG TPA: hypothetical protein VMX14_00450 [Anaerolineae bacterium]|nr:hypothetical protein [Anaerolineae bacterium]